jgi:hypothetical protein
VLEVRRTENGHCIVVPGPKERVSRDLGTTSQTGRPPASRTLLCVQIRINCRIPAAGMRFQFRDRTVEVVGTIQEGIPGSFCRRIRLDQDRISVVEHLSGKLGQPLRVAVTGGAVSPPIDVTLQLIGQERTIARLDRAIRLVRARADAS